VSHGHDFYRLPDAGIRNFSPSEDPRASNLRASTRFFGRAVGVLELEESSVLDHKQKALLIG
jgi:hypothetical protein